MATTPTPAPAPVPSVVPAVHGPYEDLFIVGLTVLEQVIQGTPPEVKQQFWKDWLAFHSNLQTFAEKVDIFHLFHASI